MKVKLNNKITARTHPPIISGSSAKQIGIVNDIKMRQSGSLWEASGALEGTVEDSERKAEGNA